MNDENTKFLIDTYPNLFKGHTFKDNVYPFHFECGDGWFTIIKELASCIDHEVKNRKKVDQYKISRGESIEEWHEPYVIQVKEKYGGLRFYVYSSMESINGMITMAEAMSYRVCELCGNPGVLSQKGWWRTLCEPCRLNDEKRAAEWEQNYKKAVEKLDK